MHPRQTLTWILLVVHKSLSGKFSNKLARCELMLVSAVLKQAVHSTPRQSTSQPVQLGCQTSSLNHSNRASPAEADPHTSSCKFHAAMQPCSRLPSLTHSRAAATHLMLSTPTHANEKQLLQQQACSKCNAATYNLSHVLQSQKQTLQVCLFCYCTQQTLSACGQ